METDDVAVVAVGTAAVGARPGGLRWCCTTASTTTAGTLGVGVAAAGLFLGLVGLWHVRRRRGASAATD